MPKQKKKLASWPIKCAVCGNERRVTKHWAKYCGDRCKAIGWAMRQSEISNNAR